MLLTKEQQGMFDGEFGEAAQQSMEILVALGKIYSADKLIPITSAQIAGVSYKTIGDAGLEYLQDLASKNAKVKIPSFLNPAGMDKEQWKEMKIPDDFAKKQIQILDSYIKMEIKPTCTCTPYSIGIRPKLKEHIAWSESSAVSFANSVLGARTNREGGPSALAAAICGVTPYCGLHLDENRISKLSIKVESNLETPSDFGAMGYFLGPKVKGKIPSFKGISSATEDQSEQRSVHFSPNSCEFEDQLKSLGAAMAATGSVPLYYIENVTPEYIVSENPEEITFEQKELEEIKEEINSETKGTKLELIAIGCPHASLEEIKKVSEIVKGKKLICDLWICTSRAVREKAAKESYLRTIEEAGGKIIADTCMVVCPIEEIGYKTTAVNSGKAAKYLPGFNKQKVIFGNLEEVITNALKP